MNASSAIRADFIRTSRLSFHNGRISRIQDWPAFQPVDHLAHREKCDEERNKPAMVYDTFEEDVEKGSVSDFDEQPEMSTGEKLRRMVTVFPWRDCTWLVAVIFAVGSLDFTINAFFGLLPLVAPALTFEGETTLAVTATIFIGATAFTVAGILDFFGAFNADRGALQVEKSEEGKDGKKKGTLRHKPPLIGDKDWIWVPTRSRFIELLLTNKPFQAGLMQLVGGAFFITSAFTGLLGFIPPDDPNFPLLAFGPQVVGGSLFMSANLMLTVCCEQEVWWRPKPLSIGWQATFQSAIGGAGFLATPLFLFQNKVLEGAVAAFVGSWAFLVGSLLGWVGVMEYC